MASILSGSASGLGYSSALFNQTGLSQRLTGKPDRLQFVGPRGVILQLDATVSEDHSREATVTEFPIEGGGTINDHIILKPPELTITGTISDTPLADLKKLLTESVGVPLGAAFGPLGTIAGGTAFGLYKALQGSAQPSVLAFGQLCRMQSGAVNGVETKPPDPFDVITGLKRYSSMVIQSLSVPRTPATSRCLTFTVKLVQLNVVTPQTIAVSVFSNSRLAANKKHVGDQELEPINGAEKGYVDEKATTVSQKVNKGALGIGDVSLGGN